MKLQNYYAALVLLVFTAFPAFGELIEEGLLLDLNAEGIEHSEDGSVSRWSDPGNSYAFVVPKGKSGGKVMPDAIAGHAAVRFSKAGDSMLQLPASLAAAFNPGSSAMTFVILCKPESYEGWGTLLRKGNFKASDQAGYNIAAISGGEGRFVTRVATMNGEKAGAQISTSNSGAGYQIYSTIIQPGGVEAFLNGAKGSVFGTDQTYSGTVNPPDSVFLGVDYEGEIAAILAYDRALSAEELTKVTTHLAEKYALDIPAL